MELGPVKHALNNEIILFKKPLTQARLYTINKLTRKIKELKSKNVPEDVKEKLNRKAESYLEEVFIMKKVKSKDLVRFALKCDEDVSKYISKADISKEQRSMARLLSHKALINVYKVFRQKYGGMQIDELLSTKKKKGKQLKKKLVKSKKKNLEKVKQSFPLDLDTDETSQNIDDFEQSDLESEAEELLPIKSISNKKKIEKNVNLDKSKKAKISRNQPLKKADKNIKESEFKELPKVNKPNKIQNKQSLDDSYSKKSKLASLHLDKVEDTYKKISNKDVRKKYSKVVPMVKNVIDQDIKAEPVTTDSFFITAKGDAYKTLTESRPQDEIKESDGFGNRRMRRAAMLGKECNQRPTKIDRHYGNFNVREPKSFNNTKVKAVKGRSNQKNTMSKPMEKEIVKAEPQNLHPSWAAKKMKSGIADFKGKKIVFDDDL